MPITVLITEHELKLSVGGTQVDPIPMTRNDKQQLDVAKLVDQLKKMKQSQPGPNAITLSTEDAVKYEDLVRVIDACIGNQFPSVSVSPASNT